MSRRSLPQSFTCKGCDQVITLAPPPAYDTRTQYCSLACKMKVWWRTHEKTEQLSCLECGARFRSTGSYYCSGTCKDQAFRKRLKPAITLTCIQCKKAFISEKRIQKATCSLVCRYARLKGQLQGKKYRPQAAVQQTCTKCRRVFTSIRAVVCARCKHPPGHGKPERRAKRAGVPYIYGIKPEHVFARDGWRCHLCGCSTPKRLRGKHQPTSPEVDHIIPLSVGGGHVWENVACACRKCNGLKGAIPKGQQRLSLYLPIG